MILSLHQPLETPEKLALLYTYSVLGGAGKLWQMLVCFDEGGLYQRDSLTCILKGGYDLNVESWGVTVLVDSICVFGWVCRNDMCKVLGVGIGKIF